MNLEGKKILVTGGTGFIGSHTARALLNKGAQVVIADNSLNKKSTPLLAAATWYQADITGKGFEEVFEKERPDVVYHFACNTYVPKSIDSPQESLKSVKGTLNTLANAKKYGVQRIIFSSSGFVYGNTKKLPTKETDPVAPTSPYAIAKSAEEQYLRFFRQSYGLPYVILRYAAVYGPGQVTGAMADYIRKLSEGRQAEIWGDGSKTRDYVYIEDVVSANMLALQVPEEYPDPIFNIGTGVETTLNDLYKKIAYFFGEKAEPIYLPEKAGEQLRSCLSYTKALQVMGWAPAYTLEEGLKLRIK